MKIAVLGCGPAGLIAAHAALHHDHQHEIDILSKPEKSPFGGAQYLHRPIPNLDAPRCIEARDVTYSYFGSAREYAEKVYGDPEAPCSFDKMPRGTVPGWSPQAAYDVLWELWEPRIVPYIAGLGSIGDLLSGGYDHVISTIPVVFLLESVSHRETVAWIKEIEPPMGSDNMIVYQGSPKVLWHRRSFLFGRAWEEVSGENVWRRGLLDSEMIERGYVKITKPIESSFDQVEGVTFTGRMGKWDKNVLLSDVYDEVLSALHNL